MADTLWLPRSAFERLSNCVFLGRIIDKARRKTSGLPIGEYMYGDNDYMDSRVLRFLGTTAADLNALVRSQPSDETAGRTLIERSGKSPKQIEWFNTRMLLAYGAIFAMFDADEGRKTGVLATLLAGFYNRILYPPFAKKFCRDEARAKS
ncbi:MAG: DUF5069 domain-containing protein [Vulcanimicrobiaceae bacterium]